MPFEHSDPFVDVSESLRKILIPASVIASQSPKDATLLSRNSTPRPIPAAASLYQSQLHHSWAGIHIIDSVILPTCRYFSWLWRQSHSIKWKEASRPRQLQNTGCFNTFPNNIQFLKNFYTRCAALWISAFVFHEKV